MVEGRGLRRPGPQPVPQRVHPIHRQGQGDLRHLRHGGAVPGRCTGDRLPTGYGAARSTPNGSDVNLQLRSRSSVHGVVASRTATIGRRLGRDATDATARSHARRASSPASKPPAARRTVEHSAPLPLRCERHRVEGDPRTRDLPDLRRQRRDRWPHPRLHVGPDLRPTEAVPGAVGAAPSRSPSPRTRRPPAPSHVGRGATRWLQPL